MSVSEDKDVRVDNIPCGADLFTFRGMRKVAMRRAWELADEAEKRGEPMRLGDFGKFMRQAYGEVRRAQETCPVPGQEKKD